LAAGQTGLSCAFDLPTQMGYDSDHPRSEGEVGKVGVAIDSIDDMRILLADLPLSRDARERLAALNPQASMRMANRLLEASDRKYWAPDAATLAALQNAADALEDRMEGIAAE
ncbi:methylmalonyl-CoA mutase family protein, partial [Yoonia sp.]|uniref:methylmalonyl-CoA mutase family protein n=1 Tax=Yoonia sp. TaxID=2212373 RepID=UPI003A4D98FE